MDVGARSKRGTNTHKPTGRWVKFAHMKVTLTQFIVFFIFLIKS